MSFSGGSDGTSGVTAHKHNSQSGEGGPLQFKDSIVNGTSIQFNGGSEIPAEVLL